MKTNVKEKVYLRLWQTELIEILCNKYSFFWSSSFTDRNSCSQYCQGYCMVDITLAVSKQRLMMQGCNNYPAYHCLPYPSYYQLCRPAIDKVINFLATAFLY